MTDDKRAEGPAKVILQQGPIGSYEILEIAGVVVACDEEWLKERADQINRALAPLIAKAEAAEKMEKALKAVLIMKDTVKPMKLDAALTWRENDEKADSMAHEALAAWEKAKKEK
jgi:hypothetical protein